MRLTPCPDLCLNCCFEVLDLCLFYQGVTKKEKEDGGKLISSIDSLDFSVASKKDVEVSVKDTKGWELVQASPTVYRRYCSNHTFVTQRFQLFWSYWDPEIFLFFRCTNVWLASYILIGVSSLFEFFQYSVVDTAVECKIA